MRISVLVWKGSQYLANLLSTAENVISFHEPEPQMSEEYNELVIKKGFQKTYANRCIKAKAIKDLLKVQTKETIYAETNHMFIKTFFDVILKGFNPDSYEINVIVLRRYMPAVLKSRVELGHFREKPIHGIQRRFTANEQAGFTPQTPKPPYFNHYVQTTNKISMIF